MLVTERRRSAREEREYQAAQVHRLAPNNRSFGDRLAAFRKGAGLTQLQLASRAGVAFTVVSNAEYGRNQPTARSLFALARALGVSMDELYGGARVGD